MIYDYKRDFLISYTGLDSKAEFNLVYAIEFVQNMMTEYFESFKSDNLRIKKTNNAAWVMTKTKLKFSGNAGWLDTIKARGYTTKNTPIRSYTESVFYTQNKKLLFFAKQEYAAIDLTTRRPRKISTIDYPTDMEYEKSINEMPFLRLSYEFNEKDFVYNQKVYYSDIDFSNHTNNVMYVRYLLNTLTSKFFNEHQVDEFEIHYIHESGEGDVLSIYKKETDNNHIEFLIKNNENEVVRASLIYK